jgi:hypothetical protein
MQWLTQWMDDPFHKQEYVMFSRLSYHNYSVRHVVLPNKVMFECDKQSAYEVLWLSKSLFCR